MGNKQTNTLRPTSIEHQTNNNQNKANANANMVLGRRGMNSSWLVAAFVVLLALVVAVSAAHTDDINVRKLQQFTAPPPTTTTTATAAGEEDADTEEDASAADAN